MKYLITGGAGFIGSHLAEAILDKGDCVDIIDNLSTGREANIAHLKFNPKFRVFYDSIENVGLLSHIVKQVDVVIHLAALVGVRQILSNPVATIQTNIMGTELVLQEAVKGNKKVFIASTSEVYGHGVQHPFSEDQNLLLGNTTTSRWGYAASKIVDEFLSFAYAKERNLPIVIGRFFNIVGERQIGNYGMVLPTFVKQAMEDKPITIYGDGTQVRCFCYVKNCVDDILKLLEKDRCTGEIFNVGDNTEVSIQELATQVKHTIGSLSEITYTPYDKAYGHGFEDMQKRVPDLSKIKSFIEYNKRDELNFIINKVKTGMEVGYGL
tara:strand:+ start:1446 stop:2417 length:972 start_codon:yes stop_codon:yes gene_type:complete